METEKTDAHAGPGTAVRVGFFCDEAVPHLAVLALAGSPVLDDLCYKSKETLMRGTRPDGRLWVVCGVVAIPRDGPVAA